MSPRRRVRDPQGAGCGVVAVTAAPIRSQNEGHNMSGNGYFGNEARKIFDIPIYRCTEQKYWSEQKEDRNTYIQNFRFDPSSREPHVII